MISTAKEAEAEKQTDIDTHIFNIVSHMHVCVCCQGLLAKVVMHIVIRPEQQRDVEVTLRGLRSSKPY